MKKEFTIRNITHGGTQTINFMINTLPISKMVSCIEEMHVRNLCKTGCTNYGNKWSCPPYSRKITELLLTNDYDGAIIICGYINLNDMNYINNSYQRIKAANMILKSKCEKMVRQLEKKLGGYSLLSGSCNLCKPCYKKRGLPCKKPDTMRYSLESTGINVELLMEKYCNHKLLWYKKGHDLQYTSVVTMLLTNNINISGINFEFLIK